MYIIIYTYQNSIFPKIRTSSGSRSQEEGHRRLPRISQGGSDDQEIWQDQMRDAHQRVRRPRPVHRGVRQLPHHGDPHRVLSSRLRDADGAKRMCQRQFAQRLPEGPARVEGRPTH